MIFQWLNCPYCMGEIDDYVEHKLRLFRLEEITFGEVGWNNNVEVVPTAHEIAQRIRKELNV